MQYDGKKKIGVTKNYYCYDLCFAFAMVDLHLFLIALLTVLSTYILAVLVLICKL